MVRECIQHSSLNPSDSGDPLSSRAWALQERLISRRILHFTSRELLWECKTQQLCECSGWQACLGDLLQHEKLAFEVMASQRDDESQLGKRPPYFLSTHQQNRMWHEIIKNYSGRALTVAEDKLPAFSAIAKILVTEENYLAGLRKDNFIPDLLWKVVQPLES
jgi:hypothetical protein